MPSSWIRFNIYEDSIHILNGDLILFDWIFRFLPIIMASLSVKVEYQHFFVSIFLYALMHGFFSSFSSSIMFHFHCLLFLLQSIIQKNSRPPFIIQKEWFFFTFISCSCKKHVANHLSSKQMRADRVLFLALHVSFFTIVSAYKRTE